MAYRTARVVAVELDPVWADRLRAAVARAGVSGRVQVVSGDLRRAPLPSETYRVIANPPFGLTTAVLTRLLDDPRRGPWRADLPVQAGLARKRSQVPPTTLRSAAWAPWWIIEKGPGVPPPPPSVQYPEWMRRFSWSGGGNRRFFPNGWHPPCEN